MATPAKRAPPPTPPDKGSFPLDHFGDCQAAQAEYLTCVRASMRNSFECKPLMKSYLECRMKHGLMAQEDLGRLGFDDGAAAQGTSQKQQPKPT